MSNPEQVKVLSPRLAVCAGGGPQLELWQAVASATKLSSFVTQLLRNGATIAYSGLLGAGVLFNDNIIFV